MNMKNICLLVVNIYTYIYIISEYTHTQTHTQKHSISDFLVS